MRLLIPGFSLELQSNKSVDLARYYGVPLVTLSGLLAEAMRSQTALGDRARACLESGKLVPDSLILNLLEERLTEADMLSGWVLSGFPRTVNQAAALRSMLRDIAQPYDAVIYLQCSLSLLAIQTPLANFYRRLDGLMAVHRSMSLTAIDHVLKLSFPELTDVELTDA